MENFLHRIFYGFISGLTEFLPVSAYPHQMIYKEMTGFQPDDPWLKVFVLLGSLAALVFCHFTQIRKLMHENKLSKQSRRKTHPLDKSSMMTIRTCKTALIPITISIVLYGLLLKWLPGFEPLIITLILNGILLFIPRLLPTADRGALGMTRMDGILVGLSGALGAVSGFSRVGCMSAVGVIRGMKLPYILETALLISVIPLTLLLVFCFVAAILAQAALTPALLIADVLACALSFGGACLGVWLLRTVCQRFGISFFGYYSWGAALICLILYMIT